jgi:hypothetical protein
MASAASTNSKRILKKQQPGVPLTAFRPSMKGISTFDRREHDPLRNAHRPSTNGKRILKKQQP